jgi:hypothetical protein
MVGVSRRLELAAVVRDERGDLPASGVENIALDETGISG